MDESDAARSSSQYRRAARWSAAIDERVFRARLGRAPCGPSRTISSAVLILASALLGLAVLTLFGTGVYLVVAAAAVWKVLGVVLVLIAVVIRPRWPRRDYAAGAATRADQPALFALVDAVADAAGTPRAQVIVLTDGFESSCGRFGLGRKVVLTIGLPLWASLRGRGRVALLASNLGHLVTKDPRHRVVAAPALTTVAALTELFDPTRVGRNPSPNWREQYPTAHGGFYDWFGSLLTSIVFLPIWLVSAGLQRVLRALSARSIQHAAYDADAIAVRTAGSAGAEEYLVTLLLAEHVSTVVCRWLRVGAGIGFVGELAEDVRAGHRNQLPDLEELSISQAPARPGLPPVGRRLRLIRSWPEFEATLVCRPDSDDAVDRGLGSDLRRVERALASSNER